MNSSSDPRSQAARDAAQERAAAAALKAKNTRRRHKNSHNGCKNCKQRRIKCDESLPECNNCFKLSQSRGGNNGTYAKCSYLEMPEAELKKLRSKSDSPIPKGKPLSSTTTQRGNYQIKTYPNKSPFFKKMFITFERLQELAATDRQTVMNRHAHDFFLKIHLTKMLLLSSVADMYFQTFQSFSCNYLKRTEPKNEAMYHKLSLKFFGNSVACQKILLSNLSVLTPCHFNYLTSSTMILGWNSIYQEAELHSYASFSTGILSIIGTALQAQAQSQAQAQAAQPQSQAQSKKDILSLEVAGDNIIQSFKTCFIPSYDASLLKEIYGNLNSLQDDSIEYNNLVEFMQNLMNDLKNDDEKLNSMSTYSPKFMYKLLTKWYSIIPSELFNVGYENFEMEESKLIVMCYYLTMGQVLLAIFPEVMFFFSVTFIGIFPLPFSKAFRRLNYHCVYLSRVYNFLKERMDILFKEIAFKSLESLKNEDIFVKGVKLTNIRERFIRNFNNTIIKPENYPHNERDQSSSSEGDVMFKALQDYNNVDDEFANNFSDLSYDEIDLQKMWENEFDQTTGFLYKDYHHSNYDLHEIGDNRLILANTENLEIVYRIRLRLLHS